MNIKNTIFLSIAPILVLGVTFSFAFAADLEDGGDVTYWGGGSDEAVSYWGGGSTGADIIWGGGNEGTQAYRGGGGDGGDAYWGGGGTGADIIWGGGNDGTQNYWGGGSDGSVNYWGGGSDGKSDYWGGGSDGSVNLWGGGSDGKSDYWGGGSDGSVNLWGGGSDEVASYWGGGYDCYSTCVMQDEVIYSYSESFEKESCGYCSTSSYSSGGAGKSMAYSTPKTYSSPPIYNPSYPKPPISYPPTYYPPQYPPQQQRPIVTTPTSNVTTNTCTYGSCNTNVNNIDNSINGSFNTTQLAQATPQYLVQYTYPTVVPPTPIPPQPALYCTITASSNFIQNGQAAILSWTSYGASSAWLSDGIGMVALNGTLPVRPNMSTSYTLTVNGYGGVRTCSVYVTVAGMAPYVSLSQIPYTGFDLGTFGNSIYWIGLLAFAASLAYLVLYYRGGAANFAHTIFGSRRANVAEGAKTPAMFAETYAPKAFAPARAAESRPMEVGAQAKDSMTFATSGNDTPRIVVNRS